MRNKSLCLLYVKNYVIKKVHPKGQDKSKSTSKIMRLLLNISIVAIDALLNQNCSTPDAASQCASNCDRDQLDCVQHCPPSDASCHSECTRQRVQCEERCPCLGELCWSGCPCLDNPHQPECGADVDFVAVSPVSTGSHHLMRWIGKSHRSWTVEFEPKLTKTSNMCGVVVKGQLFLFGGGKGNARTAYHVVGCHLQPMLPLGFSFDYGICSATEGGTGALLCSPHTTGTECWKFNGLGFSKMARLMRSHTDGAVADAYGTLTVVAGGNTLDVEQYEASSARWFVAGDMKAVLGDHLGGKYTHFSLAAINHKLFCFGGMQGSNSPVSMVYTMDVQTKEWSHHGKMWFMWLLSLNFIFQRNPSPHPVPSIVR